MQLRSNGTSLLGAAPHARHREPIDPRRAAAILTAQGYRPVVAQAVAAGALVCRADALALARQLNLIEWPSTDAARAAGLVQ